MYDFDEAMIDVKRGFTQIENDFELTIHELRGRLSRMDLLTRPSAPLPVPGPSDTVVTTLPVPVPVFGPREVYGPLANPHAEPVIPTSVQLHADLPWWRRWLRRMDRRFARNLEVSA